MTPTPLTPVDVTFDSVSVSLGGHPIVQDVDLHVPAGCFLGLLGPNGSGKSTLLRTLYKVHRPSTGAVLVGGSDVVGMKARDAARHIAVLAQEVSTDFSLTVDDVVMLGRTPHQTGFGANSTADRELADESLELVNASHLAGRPFATLSGGEKQRVLLARAFTQQAPVLVLDEPTNHLDIGFQLELMQLVASRGVTVIAALHEINVAAQFCDRIAVMVQGRLVDMGTPAEVLRPEILNPAFRVSAHSVPHPVTGRPVITFDHPASPARPQPAAFPFPTTLER